MNVLFVRLAAALGFIAVALGAFGAHALKAKLEARGFVSAWDKAVLYQFVHTLAILAFALTGTGHRVVCYLFVAGIALFSGSLYLMALTNVRTLGAITPLGGLCFLAGWAWLIFQPRA